MKHLLRLEWKKHNLSHYVMYACLCAAAVYAITVIMAVISVREGEMMFADYESFSSFLGMMLRIVFQIFSATVLVRLVVDEYVGGTMEVMFVYPISRKKILMTKMMLAGLFTFLPAVISGVGFALATVGLQHIFFMYEGSITVYTVATEIPGIFMLAVMAAGMSLIPVVWGIHKRSASSVITSAVILSLLLNGTASGSGNGQSLFEMAVVPVVLAAVGVWIGYLGWKNVDKVDVKGGKTI